jgi:hypothetical protein
VAQAAVVSSTHAQDPSRWRDDDVLVEGVCRCDCSNIHLRATGRPFLRRESRGCQPPDETSTSPGADAARTADGHEEDIVLHLVHGRVCELEVFDTVGGEGVAVPLDDLTELTARLMSLSRGYRREGGAIVPRGQATQLGG